MGRVCSDTVRYSYCRLIPENLKYSIPAGELLHLRSMSYSKLLTLSTSAGQARGRSGPVMGMVAFALNNKSQIFL